jgi:hypothetical protein
MEEIKTKVSPELKYIGINDIYQLSINPWIVYYKIGEENESPRRKQVCGGVLNPTANKNIKILLVLDGRRNIERILISKVIDNKL